MDLKKYFNLSFFKENIKKSKGIIAFFFGVVPLLNILMLIVFLYEKENLINFSLLSSITMIGLYIIPFILAFTLFGFIFKQKSVDFILSKPISRKSIYWTNILGGTIILICFMLLNTFIFGIFSLLFSSLVLPFGLLLDYFIYFLISYIFVFFLSSLAIILSGNLITSLVIIMLLIFLIPFLQISTNTLSDNNSATYIKCEYENCKPKNYECFNDHECINRLSQDEYKLVYEKELNLNLTAPLNILVNIEKGIYSTSSIYKMSILSFIYLILGLLAFMYRKMENNETSFKKEWVHYFVKTLTFIPIGFVSYIFLREKSFIGILVILAISLIYYIVYDLVTRKEIYKFKKSLIICLASLGILTGFYALFDKKSIETFSIEEIKTLTLNDSSTIIKDKDLITKFMVDALNKERQEDIYNRVNVKINTDKNTYKLTLKLSLDNYNLLNDKIKELNQEKIKEFDYKNFDYATFDRRNIPVTKKLKKLLEESLKNDDETMNSNGSIQLYDYKNHQYEIITFPLNNQALFNHIINEYNQAFKKTLEKNKLEASFSFYNYQSDNELFSNLDVYTFNYVINKNLSSFKEFINNEKVDLKDSLLYIEMYSLDGFATAIVNGKKLKEELDQYKVMLQNDETYQNLLKEYSEIG